MLIIILMILKGSYRVTEYVLCRDKKEENEQEELLKRAEELKQEGWLVDDLIETINTDTEQGRKTLAWYEGRIDSLRRIKNKYESLDADGYQLKTEELEIDMLDPRNDPTGLEKRVDRLADWISKKKSKEM